MGHLDKGLYFLFEFIERFHRVLNPRQWPRRLGNSEVLRDAIIPGVQECFRGSEHV
jgi:hypothetical protein